MSILIIPGIASWVFGMDLALRAAEHENRALCAAAAGTWVLGVCLILLSLLEIP